MGVGVCLFLACLEDRFLHAASWSIKETESSFPLPPKQQMAKLIGVLNDTPKIEIHFPIPNNNRSLFTPFYRVEQDLLGCSMGQDRGESMLILPLSQCRGHVRESMANDWCHHFYGSRALPAILQFHEKMQVFDVASQLILFCKTHFSGNNNGALASHERACLKHGHYYQQAREDRNGFLKTAYEFLTSTVERRHATGWVFIIIGGLALVFGVFFDWTDFASWTAVLPYIGILLAIYFLGNGIFLIG